MKVAVIGGGTTGYMAAAMLTHHYPDLELYHIYDPAIPTIGVGEGTLCSFPTWLHEMTGLPEAALQSRCGVTRKYGITFENWGSIRPAFLHHFTPAGYAYSYHISAPSIVELLEQYVTATKIEKKVRQVESDGHEVTIHFADADPLVVGFAFDARGFPAMTEPGVDRLTIIPTNAARVRTGPPVEGQATTRSVARPHGWIFVIPLTMRTAYGYIYNADISSAEEVERDHLEFLASERVEPRETVRELRFPNFTRRRFFDGALFTIGNRASFLEPLEATAIGMVSTQLETARLWPLGEWRAAPLNQATRQRNIETLNRYLYRYVQKMALFVGWHYAAGSLFKSPFWEYAVANFWEALEQVDDRALLSEFSEYLARANDFDSLAQYVAQSGAGRPARRSSSRPRFGPWTLESFIEMGQGLGCRSLETGAMRAR
jgi:tryptophan halogenase